MGLRGLINLFTGSFDYQELRQRVTNGSSCTSGDVRVKVPDSTRPYLIASLSEDLGRPILVLTAKQDQATRLANDLSVLMADIDDREPQPGSILHLVHGGGFPFEQMLPDETLEYSRLNILSTLATHHPGGSNKTSEDRSIPDSTLSTVGSSPIVISSLQALLQRTSSRDNFQAASSHLRVGQSIRTETLLKEWVALGYTVEPLSETPGTVSRRGGILDIYPPDLFKPVRIELFGSVIESIRSFDPVTQRSTESMCEICIIPARVMLPLNFSSIGSLPARRMVTAIEKAEQISDRLQEIKGEIASILDGNVIDGVDFYIGLFEDRCLVDYLPTGTLVVILDPDSLEDSWRELASYIDSLRRIKENRGELPADFPSPYLDWPEVLAAMQSRHQVMEIDWNLTDQKAVFDATPPPGFWGRFNELFDWIREKTRTGGRTIILTEHSDRVRKLLGDEGVATAIWDGVNDVPAKGSVNLVSGTLSEGFVLELSGNSLSVLTDAEIFGTRKQRGSRRRRVVNRQAFLSELVPGTYVVHSDHGIGKFVGTYKQSDENGEQEYITVEYAEHDRLHVPTGQIDKLSSYFVPGEASPRLTRLGTQEWVRAKERARDSTKKMAADLLDLYAKRQITPGRAISPDTPWQQQLEASFIHTETRDQLEAIEDVKQSMEAAYPMDRLVCGDVGYGKTEIAVRAAFKAIQDGLQVAILCPTTVLAQQHYETFVERLSVFPVNVGVLSRLQKSLDQKEILRGMESGSVDIVIGTHRLLQKDVKFKDLGLVIIDDEQRFGVAQKERFKQFRQDIDVLTMTATPIPRTLSMALSGVRDMSMVHTPPEERQAVRCFVGEFNEEVVRTAILHEIDRNGQIFFVHNRIRDINEWANWLSRLVPQARVAIGHGRMNQDDLSSIMSRFMAGKIDILVCTTIIEAGLDLPNANTLVVHRPELMGLAQMYQLRGRVGRGARRGYAYFLTPRGTKPTGTAEKRLRAILAYQELGAGFRIAMKDLEIRGAGNLLGSEQSGHIQAVGFDLYSRLLEEEVANLKKDNDQLGFANVLEQSIQPAVDLPSAAFIPDNYIDDLPLRLGFYQRLAQLVETEEVVVIGEELIDRFGEMPEPVKNLLFVVRVKVLARPAGISVVTKQAGKIILRFQDPIGGAKPVFEKEFGPRFHIGNSIMQIPMLDGWKDELLRTLGRLADFRERMFEVIDQL